MYIYFNKEGKATTLIPHGEIPRQGSYLNLYICFEEDFINPNDTVVGVELLLPGTQNRTTVSKAPEIGYPDVKIFKKAIGNEVTYDLIDGKKYLMYKYSFAPSISTIKNGDLDVFVSVSHVDEDGVETGLEYLTKCTIHIEKVFGYSTTDREIDETNYEQIMTQINKLMISKIDKKDFVVNNIEFDGRNFIITTQNKVQLEDGTETDVLVFPILLDDAVAIDEIEIDDEVRMESNNLVTSGAVYSAIGNIHDTVKHSVEIILNLESYSYYIYTDVFNYQTNWNPSNSVDSVVDVLKKGTLVSMDGQSVTDNFLCLGPRVEEDKISFRKKSLSDISSTGHIANITFDSLRSARSIVVRKLNSIKIV